MPRRVSIFIGARAKILPGHEFLQLPDAVQRPERDKAFCALRLRKAHVLPHVRLDLRLGPGRAPETHFRHIALKLRFLVKFGALFALLLPKHDAPTVLDRFARESV